MHPLIFSMIAMFFTIAANSENIAPGAPSGWTASANATLKIDTFSVEPSVVTCLLQKGGVDLAHSTKFGKAIAEAISKIGFQRSEFNNSSLIHFLTQGIAESGGGRHLTQLGDFPIEKRGFGWIQVTGPYNLGVAQACMNKCPPPGLGKGVTTNPEMCIGNSGDPMKSVLASLCWWDNSIVNVEKHRVISIKPSIESAVSIHQIVNAGGVGKPVTGGRDAVQNRLSIFRKIEGGTTECKLFAVN